ncbi:secondary thiamine-phosphate synthase enzyme YjbQ [Candidatus Methylomirabilis sp.]|uniref:secondary thiamine-phosphate synthase enzyme YjbQ n=1 Tax=Candidatus Methylomirabilis sp. TaxID=2032687 RepID=UPI002A6462EA|nr:secondary thiamine-phosphate synthase enzyme YjbQ [Candidatus Methylomirabilis sp.]
MKEFFVKTERKCQVIDITPRVQTIVAQDGSTDGLCCVFVPHATAAVTINENADPNIGEDLQDALTKLVPEGVWRHDRIDDNAAAHIKATIIGPSEMVPVKDRRLVLGTWQSIMLVEFDGPRERRVIVQIR